jgi:uncharacterized protein GlcG (DUF336 family)
MQHCEFRNGHHFDGPQLTREVLVKHLIIFSALIGACSAANGVLAATDSGFPGDHGRPFNGLPLPEGPLPPPPPARPVPRGPSLELALEAAKAAVEACKGYHVGISVIDSAGTPKLYYIPDGTDGSHAYTGFRKAYTALTFKMPTSRVGASTKSDPSVVAKITADPNLLSFAGGLPLTVGNEVIGALGVSGAEPSAKDEECAIAGVNKIKDRLK